MLTRPREIRCVACRSLLAIVGETGLVIRRGELQATIDGELRAALVCYRRGCHRQTVVQLSAAGRCHAAPDPRV